MRGMRERGAAIRKERERKRLRNHNGNRTAGKERVAGRGDNGAKRVDMHQGILNSTAKVTRSHFGDGKIVLVAHPARGGQSVASEREMMKEKGRGTGAGSDRESLRDRLNAIRGGRESGREISLQKRGHLSATVGDRFLKVNVLDDSLVDRRAGEFGEGD